MNKMAAAWLLAALITAFGPIAARGSQPLPAEPPGACEQAREALAAAGQEHTLLAEDTAILREELDRLEAFRKDILTATRVLKDAGELSAGGAGLSPAQLMTLNSRLPAALAAFDADGRVSLTAEKSSPLTIDEALVKLRVIGLRAAEDTRDNETALRKKEQEIALLGKKTKSLEVQAAECSKAALASESPVPAIQAPSGEIYRRYVEREQLRQDEVSTRAYLDLERLYLRAYQGYQRRHGAGQRAGPRSRAVLIGLYGESNGHVGRYCIPFGSEAEKSWILDEYRRAARGHERIPGLGRLQDVKVLEAFEDLSLCRSKLR
jgi:hypothetical protein